MTFTREKFGSALLAMLTVAIGATGLIGIMRLVAMNAETQATIMGVLILQAREELILMMKRFDDFPSTDPPPTVSESVVTMRNTVTTPTPHEAAKSEPTVGEAK